MEIYFIYVYYPVQILIYQIMGADNPLMM